MTKLATTLLCLGAIYLNAQAQLSFVTLEQHFQASLGQEATLASYAFVNDGDKPLTIREVKTSCGCTTSELPKKIFAPGEEGEITLNFKHEGRTGPQRKTAYVVYEDVDLKPSVLTLSVDIPVAFKVKPPLLYWPAGKEQEEMRAELQFFVEEEVEIEAVRSLNPAWEVEAIKRKGDQGQSYDLIARPVGAIAGQRGTVIVTTKPELMRIHLYLRGQ